MYHYQNEKPIGCRCMALDDPDWHSKECWLRQTAALRQQLAEMTAERNAAETRNENYRMKLNASDSVIAQLSEHLAEDQAEITRLQEKP